ncbi:MAG: T9SS type A sorting domain-containing protein [Candidatus Eisenbacteria bacterium]|uniref:T9SS type A sorting domain-containing protein n=1 Tax=Eiseniibacteriota bacterium TaxID=2212470 RepID=A0A9D6L826_UNCEI|nr:T9SS type A sorting domain-containing protein [Candidatus Eisenbacteria bacterium]MBI3538645.1 T9SS type A sorting domain-containing protein [Candidatus Eisenbacteria bacterium]
MQGALSLRFALPRDAEVSLAIYDAAGREVRTLASGAWPAGDHDVTWDGRDRSGRATASGLYLVRLEAEGRTIVRRVMTLR